MGMEFHNREFSCASGSIIPSGPGYDDPSLQSCAATGVQPGEMSANGDDYLRTEFGFSHANIGRDFGILILFMVGFLLINMILVEKVDWAEGGGGALKFARQSKASGSPPVKDEESTDTGTVTPVIEEEHLSKEIKGLVKSGSTFTWKDLNYSVRHKDGDKHLLNGISGFCEPGKLTALVGASGAGKSTRKSALSLILNLHANVLDYSDGRVNSTIYWSSDG